MVRTLPSPARDRAFHGVGGVFPLVPFAGPEVSRVKASALPDNAQMVPQRWTTWCPKPGRGQGHCSQLPGQEGELRWRVLLMCLTGALAPRCLCER